MVSFHRRPQFENLVAPNLLFDKGSASADIAEKLCNRKVARVGWGARMNGPRFHHFGYQRK